ncbi:hypothetical protein ACHAWO_006462 [Cyclotella atomus]|uniref:HSF-type DNA-binding domain-containing protein n=1 Tax=Cyclotella atomus TaxID=382360 RepID=A0ABD3Q1L3_9STRA
MQHLSKQDGSAMNSTQGEEKKRRRNTGKSVIVDHTYSDYSTYELSISEKRKGRVTFPMKLHAIISNPEYQHIICWMPHGRSWKIIDKDKLASVVCYENFNHDSFGSFTRSVNGWGFKRMVGPGPDQRSYYHECFLRGKPDLAQLITRVTTPGKKLPNPNGEPDFYDICMRFPLPHNPGSDGHQNNASAYVAHAPPPSDCRDTKRQCQAQLSDEISHTSPTEYVSHVYSSAPPAHEHGYYGNLYPNIHGQGYWKYPHYPPSPPYPHVRRFSEPYNGHGQYNHQHWSGYENSDYQGEDAAAEARYGEYEHDLNFRLDHSTSRRATTSQLQPRFSSSAHGTDFHFQPIRPNHNDSLTPSTAWAREFSLDAENEMFPTAASSIRSTPDELGSGALAGDVKPADVFESESSNTGGWSEYLPELEVQPPATSVGTNPTSVRNDIPAPQTNLNWTLY